MPPFVAKENFVTTLCTEFASRVPPLVFLLVWAVAAAAGVAFEDSSAAYSRCGFDPGR